MNNLISPSPRKIEFSEHAFNDLEEIWLYFSELGENAADKVSKEDYGKIFEVVEISSNRDRKKRSADWFAKFAGR